MMAYSLCNRLNVFLYLYHSIGFSSTVPFTGHEKHNPNDINQLIRREEKSYCHDLTTLIYEMKMGARFDTRRITDKTRPEDRGGGGFTPIWRSNKTKTREYAKKKRRNMIDWNHDSQNTYNTQKWEGIWTQQKSLRMWQPIYLFWWNRNEIRIFSLGHTQTHPHHSI